MSIQRRNPELVDILRPDFQARYEANFGMLSSIGLACMLPGVRAAWFTSSFDEDGWIIDFSGQGRALKYNGDPEFGFDQLIPYVDLDGSGDFFQREDEDGLDITGAENFIANRGLTCGAWIQTDNISPGGNQSIISKWDGANDQSFALRILNGGTCDFRISNTGADTFTVTSTATLSNSTWAFVCGVFDRLTSLDIWVNDVQAQNVAGIPASIFQGTNDLFVGASGAAGAAEQLNGKFSMGFLCACKLSDTIIKTFYAYTCALYGV